MESKILAVTAVSLIFLSFIGMSREFDDDYTELDSPEMMKCKPKTPVMAQNVFVHFNTKSIGSFSIEIDSIG